MPPRRRKSPAPVKAAATAPEPAFTLRTPVWPERACRDVVSGEFANYSCDVVESHYGPHASNSVPASVVQRSAWEKRNPGKREPSGLADPFIAS